MKQSLARIFTVIALGALLSSCTDQYVTGNHPNSVSRQSYSIPSTLSKFNVGYIHDAMLVYINTHYDVGAHSGYPNSFSEAAYDSLAALFIQDSIQSASGPFSSVQVAGASAAFDSVFHAVQIAGPIAHSELVASVDSGLIHGLYAPMKQLL